MNDIDRLLVRYLSGTASAADEAELRRWADADPANEALVEQLREAWHVVRRPDSLGSGVARDRYDTSGELERLLERIHTPAREPIPFPAAAPGLVGARNKKRNWYSSPLVRVAAVLAIVIGTAVVLAPRHDLFFTAPQQVHATGAGERSRLQLADGTHVLLGPESEVRYSARMASGRRDIHLQGAAYFEVAPDPDRPFRVFAGGTVTRVLGTRFMIRAYAGEAAVEVAVTEGRVAVGSDTAAEERALVLIAGEVARSDADGVARKVAGGETDALLAWTEGRLVFRQRQLDEVARELERWYAVEVQIADAELAARTITLSFQDAPLEELLELISYSLGARFEREGSAVTLYPAGTDP